MKRAAPRPSSPHDAAWLAAESSRLLGFAARSVNPGGGFAWLDELGHPRAELPVYTWITCRMTHVFALGALLGDPACGKLARHGVDALAHQLRDARHGGWFAAVANGTPVTTKNSYDHAFVVLAASSAAAAGVRGSDRLLNEALQVFDTYFWDDGSGLVIDTWDRSWEHLDPYRGVNPNMHAVEALLAARDVTGNVTWLKRALSITERVIHGFARSNGWLLPEHFDSAWNPQLDYNRDDPANRFRPYGVTIGHLLEWSRLCLHLRAALAETAPDWLLSDAIALFDTAVTYGWESREAPGFVYTIDWNKQPVVKERLHWVAAEAIAAAASLYHATGNSTYADWYRRWWRHAAAFIDPVGGSWHHELNCDNKPAATIWEGKPDVYHAFQATLIPRLPLAPTLATALRNQLLDTAGVA